MINLSDFIDTINIDEALKPWEEIKPGQKKPKKSRGSWAIDEPVDDEAVEPLDKEKMTKNMKKLLMKFQTWEPFFIQGKAGWGKTSIIKKMAKRFKLRVITVYLDKARPEDLDGIPAPVENKQGKIVQEKLPPPWAAYMMEHEDEDFLLFFDEMNQAQPDVQAALMPIVLETTICGIKFDNFFVGAAGNLQEENEGMISELAAPLKSRFKPIIVWETGTTATWKETFDEYMHKEWDEKLGKDFVDLFEANATLFENPRELDHKVFRLLWRLKKRGDYDYFDAEDYKDRLDDVVKEDLGKFDKKKVEELADAMYEWIHDEKKEDTGRSGRKAKAVDISMVDPKYIEYIKQGMERGYLVDKVDGKRVKFGISRENIFKVFDDPRVNAEMMQTVIDKFEADGIKFKYEKDEDFKKVPGIVDPE